MTLVFDPGKTLPENMFTDEIHSVNVNVDVSVWPNNGAFFKNDIIVEGRSNVVEGFTELFPFIDFTWGIVNIHKSKTVPEEVFDYILMLKSYLEVRITYRAIGGLPSDALASQIARLDTDPAFDRSKITDWTYKVIPEVAFYHPSIRSKEGRELGWEDNLVIGLARITDALSGTTSSSALDLAAKLITLEAALGSKAEVSVLDEFGKVSNRINAAAADATVELYDIANAAVLELTVIFISTAKEVIDRQEVHILKNDQDTALGTSMHLRLSDDNTVSFSIDSSGDTHKLMAKAPVNGSFYTKLIRQI